MAWVEHSRAVALTSRPGAHLEETAWTSIFTFEGRMIHGAERIFLAAAGAEDRGNLFRVVRRGLRWIVEVRSSANESNFG